VTITIDTGTNTATHRVCWRCGDVLTCSEATDENWEGTGYGWCDHARDPDDPELPTVVFLNYDGSCSHNCLGEMRH
jgi:hypothetical protein